jgi:hypothetical protein
MEPVVTLLGDNELVFWQMVIVASVDGQVFHIDTLFIASTASIDSVVFCNMVMKAVK